MADAVEVVGVYAVPGAPGAQLIEVRSPASPDDFDVGALTQEAPGQPPENWQAPWMECWLDPGGGEVLTEPFDPPPAGCRRAGWCSSSTTWRSTGRS